MSIKLIPLNVSHIDYIMEWVNDPLVQVKFANIKKYTKEEELDFIKNLIDSKNDKTYSIFNNENIYLGQVSINQIHWASKNGRISIVIHPDYRGRGIATKAIKEIIHKAFNVIKLHKVWVILKTDNIKGISLFNYFGFNMEGLLKDEYVDSEGNFIDMIRMYKINNI